MKTLEDQLSNYAAYHRDRRNIATHLVGIPMIVLAVAVLLARPTVELGGLPLSAAALVAVATGLYYLRLDLRFGLVAAAVLALTVAAAQAIAATATATWLTAGVGLFVVGWIIQFVGHAYEGRKPAFVDDIVGLLIGPLFVLAEVAFRLGTRRDVEAEIERRAGPLRSGRAAAHGAR